MENRLFAATLIGLIVAAFSAAQPVSAQSGTADPHSTSQVEARHAAPRS